jgi:hypothetical protein
MFRRRYLSGLMFQSNELLTVFVLQRSLVKAEQARTALPCYSLRAPFIPFNYRLLFVQALEVHIEQMRLTFKL